MRSFRSNKENRIAPSSRASYSHLSTPEKHRRLSCLHSHLQSANSRIALLEETIETAREVVDDRGGGSITEADDGL